jgi:hypothetical protein
VTVKAGHAISNDVKWPSLETCKEDVAIAGTAPWLDTQSGSWEKEQSNGAQIQ